MISESDIPLSHNAVIPADAIRMQYSRGSGPGGQNVNKLNTRAELWAQVSGIVGLTNAASDRLRQFAGKRLTALDEIHLASDLHRTQEANRQEIIDRLRQLCLQAMREPRKRRKTRPTRASKQRRLSEKKRRGEIKQGRQNRGE